MSDALPQSVHDQIKVAAHAAGERVRDRKQELAAIAATAETNKPPEVSVAEGGPIRVEHLKILWHSLGMEKRNYRRRLVWWLDNDQHRNHFATYQKGNDFNLIEDLVARGLMAINPGVALSDGLAFYHVTDPGITLAKQEFLSR